MAKEITQIIEREKPDGEKEVIINVYDTETGKNEVGTTSYIYDGDRDRRVQSVIDDLMR